MKAKNAREHRVRKCERARDDLECVLEESLGGVNEGGVTFSWPMSKSTFLVHVGLQLLLFKVSAKTLNLHGTYILSRV